MQQDIALTMGAIEGAEHIAEKPAHLRFVPKSSYSGSRRRGEAVQWEQ